MFGRKHGGEDVARIEMSDAICVKSQVHARIGSTTRSAHEQAYNLPLVRPWKGS